MIGIYKITAPNNKIYIGQSWYIEGRKYNYSKNNCSKQPKLCNCIRKYGWNKHTFEVIHQLNKETNQEVLNELEILYWKKYKEQGYEMLNIRIPGGSKGAIAEETKKLISKSLKGKKLSRDRVQKSVEKWKEKYYSLPEEERKKKHWHKTGKDAIRSKSVNQYSKTGDFIKTWDCIIDIEKALGICHSHISAVCREKRKHAGGYKFKYNT